MDVIACDKKSTKSISNDKLESIVKDISKMSEEIEKLRTNSISIKDISSILAETTKNIENIIKDNSSISTDSKDLILENKNEIINLKGTLMNQTTSNDKLKSHVKDYIKLVESCHQDNNTKYDNLLSKFKDINNN
jgi:hypothetical protein